MSKPGAFAAMQAAWEAVLRLPDDEDSFASLDPHERRRLHDMGIRVQDRLVRTLSKLVVDMGADGADLVDSEGLPESYRDRGEPE